MGKWRSRSTKDFLRQFPLNIAAPSPNLFFSFSRASVLGDVLDRRHPAADLKNSILGEDGK